MEAKLMAVLMESEEARNSEFADGSEVGLPAMATSVLR
jgi:hypothetical protein